MPDPAPDPGGASLPGAIEDLALARLMQAGSDRGSVLDELCREHPLHAARLRELGADLAGADRVLRAGLARGAAEPEAIGPYRVVRRLGAGGFGVVYLCAQEGSLRRLVAVKVLRPGAGDRNTLLRFEAERQALAMLRHPAIANVFAAGALADGRPYFVMEHVDGKPIQAYCDQSGRSIEERLALFVLLCEGVQHAHLRGIIHRDLKPSNVLVVEHDGKPGPKIIDFGLAKVLHEPALGPPTLESPEQLLTETGRAIGTPGYMSPEQAEGRHADVDTRSDVFSLGVILYELLTGELPWKEPAAPRSSEPVRPSTRVSTLAATGPDAFDRRGLDPRRLVSRLRGDLDWIVLMALEREPARRYQSAQELALDVRRHLGHEPVRAGPPSAAYRLLKFVRRHRLQVVAAAAVLVTLLAGLASTWRFATRAQANLERFEILALGKRLEQAKKAIDELHPRWPERLPAIDRWLTEEAEPLRAELPRLRRALAELRAGALPYSAADADADRRSHALAADLARRRDMIAYEDELLAHPTLQRRELAPVAQQLRTDRDKIARELPALAARCEERHTWVLGNESEQFLHDTLAQLCDQLTAFAEGESSVIERIRQMRQLIVEQDVRGLAERRELWQATALALAGDPRFTGFELTPQVGLVPLGRDPASGLQEFYHLRSALKHAPVPTRGPAGELEIDESAGVVFVLLPGGRVLAGAQNVDAGAPCYDPGATLQESPVHEVVLAPFFLGKHELTQAQWVALAGTANPSYLQAGSLTSGRKISRRHPVESVTWGECRTALERHGLELPTEAQWEYACRAGTTSIWPTGDSVESLRGVANLADAAARTRGVAFADASFADGYSIHAPVGSFAANAFGLHDMVGNVAEWCRDYFSSLAYLLVPRAGDGLRPVPEMPVRVARGASFEDLARQGTSAARASIVHTLRARVIGVRPARRVYP